VELALALVGTLTFAAFGLGAVRAGRAVARAHGPETPMRLPLGVIRGWIADRTGGGYTSAKNVVRVGWACVLASPIFFPVAYGFDAFNPIAIHRRTQSACRELVREEDLRSLAGWDAKLDDVDDDGRHCHARFTEHDATVLQLDVGAGGSFASGSLTGQRERNGRSTTPRAIEELDDDSLWLSGPSSDTVYTEIGGVGVRIEFEAGVIGSADLHEMLTRMRAREALLRHYR